MVALPDALALANQPKEDVFSADIVVLESDRLFPRHRENFPNAVREVVIHLRPFSG